MISSAIWEKTRTCEFFKHLKIEKLTSVGSFQISREIMLINSIQENVRDNINLLVPSYN